MAQKIDDSKYLWQATVDDSHTRIGLNDLARGEIGEISFAAFPIHNYYTLTTSSKLQSLFNSVDRTLP